MRLLLLFILFQGIAFSQDKTSNSLVGTKWHMIPVGSDLPETDLMFLSEGRIYESDMEADEVDNGSNEWSQKGNKITIYYNDHYSTYTGKIKGDVMTGKAKNVTGKKWTWTGTLIQK